MIDTKLVGRWFPSLLTCSETSVPELANLLAGYICHTVIDAMFPGLAKVARNPEQVRARLCDRIRYVFALGDPQHSIRYCQTVVAVVVAWCTPNGTSVRRNLALSQILAAFATIHGMLLALSCKRVPHIRVLARAFRIELQLLMLSGVRPVNTPIIQKLLQFMLLCVFGSSYAEAMSYNLSLIHI